MLSVELKRRVRWADADPAGRIYFPRIFDYFCEAEDEILKRAGYDLEDLFGNPGREFDFPRVHAECQFKKVLQFGACFTMSVQVGRLGRTSIQYDFRVLNEGQELAAYGRVTVAVLRQGKLVEIPPALRLALSAE